MIKFIAAAIWISLATTGALMFSFQSAQPEPEAAEQPPNAFNGLDYVKSGVISVPLLKDGAVHGYFLARLVYTIPSETLAALKLPPEALLSDEVYSYLYANPQIDFSDKERIDLDAFRNGIRDSVNGRLGDKVIHEVLIEQMDYLPKSEIPASTIKRPGAMPASAPAQTTQH